MCVSFMTGAPKYFWRSRKSNLRPLVYKAYHLSTVGDKPMPCESGVIGLIPRFSIKPLSVEHSDSPVIKYKHKPSWPTTGYYPWKSHTHIFFSFQITVNRVASCLHIQCTRVVCNGPLVVVLRYTCFHASVRVF